MRLCSTLLAILIVIGSAGCRERSVPPPPPPLADKNTPSEEAPIVDIPAPDPMLLLSYMVTAYQVAASYSDRATVQIIGKMSQPDLEPASWNCVVVFQKPNRLRLEIDEGIFVSDGEDCYAQIRPLPDQVLHRPSPEHWTLETLFQDVHLDRAMELGLPRSVLRFPPQLVLLLAYDPLRTFYPQGATVEWLEQQQIGQVSCDVIQISHSDGNRILWISRENNALLRLDYQPVGLPVPVGFDSIEAIRIEMSDARFDWDFTPETFHMLQPRDAIQVAEFQSDIPGLPTPEEHRRRLRLMADSDTYRLIDLHIESFITTEQSPPPKVPPKTFSLSPIWTLPLIGVDTMAFLPSTPPQLFIPCEGNWAATLGLQGNDLNKNPLEGLEDSIVMDIQISPFSPSQEKRRIGILTLDLKLHLFDESFEPLPSPAIDEEKEEICGFQFVLHHDEELLLLGIQKDSAEEGAAGVVRATCIRGDTRWEYSFEGELNQIALATIDDQPCVLVSRTVAQQDSILVLSLEGVALDPVDIPFGRHILWFHVLDTTIYTLLRYVDTGDVRFVGFDRRGKGQWSRLLPFGEYEADPVYIPTEKKWLVPLPNGEIRIFDLLGNWIDTCSLNVVPTKLFCVETVCEEKGKETLLIVADGKTVSAWKVLPLAVSSLDIENKTFWRKPYP